MEDSWIDPSDDVHSIWWLHAPFTGLSGSSGVSLLWISNVNYFGSVGGFDMLLHRISFGCNGDDGLSEDSSKISPSISLEETMLYCSLVSRFCCNQRDTPSGTVHVGGSSSDNGLIAPTFIATYALLYHNAVLTHLLHLTPSDMKGRFCVRACTLYSCCILLFFLIYRFRFVVSVAAVNRYVSRLHWS